MSAHEDHPTPRARLRILIEDVACCPKGHYCTLKEILISAPRQAREILQIKCVEKFKYERSEREGREIDWQEAFELWISEGHAETFSVHHHDGISFAELYRRVMHPKREEAT